MKSVIEVDGLTKRYGDHVAVDDVGFTVTEGEIFGILGTNGAGKTTTEECLQGLGDPTVVDAGLGFDPRTAGSRCGRGSAASFRLGASGPAAGRRGGAAVRDGHRRSADPAPRTHGISARSAQQLRFVVGRAAPASVHRLGADQSASGGVLRRTHPGSRPAGPQRRVGRHPRRSGPGHHGRVGHPLHGRGRGPL